MKIKRAFLSFAIIFSMLVSGLYLPNRGNAAKRIKFNKKKISIKVGKKGTFKVLNTNKKVKWKIKSGKKKIKIVKKTKKKLVVKGKKKGTAKIIAKVGKKKYVLKVKVKKASAVNSLSTDGAMTVDTGYFTIGSKIKLNVGMSEDKMKAAFKNGNGIFSKQAAKSPQGYDVYTYLGGQYSSYAITYVSNKEVVSIFVVSGAMSYKGKAKSGMVKSDLSGFTADSWYEGAYKNSYDDITVNAYLDVNGKQDLYGIQAYKTSVKDGLYYPDNNNYTDAINKAMLVQMKYCIKAYQKLRGKSFLGMPASLSKVAQKYANTITANKETEPKNRSNMDSLTAMEDGGVSPGSWNEQVYWGVPDAIGMFNYFLENIEVARTGYSILNRTKFRDASGNMIAYNYIGIGVSGYKSGKGYFAIVVDMVDVI